MKVVMEIPTYPYDQEYFNKSMRRQLIQDKLFREQGINWNDLPVYQKRGYLALPKNDPNIKDLFETPIFSQEPEFINSLITFKED